MAHKHRCIHRKPARPKLETWDSARAAIEANTAAMGGWLMAQAYYAKSFTPEARAKLLKIAQDGVDQLPDVLKPLARGFRDGLLAQQMYAMGEKFAAQSKAKGNAGVPANAPPASGPTRTTYADAAPHTQEDDGPMFAPIGGKDE